MLKLTRCPKCNHIMSRQYEFVKEVTERMNRNIVKLRTANRDERKMLLNENKTYEYYMKTVLNLEYELQMIELRNTALVDEILRFCSRHNFIDGETLRELKERALENQRRKAANVAEKIGCKKGEFWNCCNNRTKPDPTARTALRNLSRVR